MKNLFKMIAVATSMSVFVMFAPNARAEYTDDCITFSSAASFTLKTWNTAKNWDGTLWTSTDKVNWSEWNGAEVASTQTGNAHNLYVRGNTSNTKITGSSYTYRWVLTGDNIVCTGNIETLRGATSILPSPTTMANNCYSFMFRGCTSLTDAPALPATTLMEDCYYSMFEGCTALTTAPVLPATTLSKSCYLGMFSGCTSLTDAPVLPAMTLSRSCYNAMFYGCTSLTNAPALPATTLADGCYDYMFRGCMVLEVNEVTPGKEWKIPATSTSAERWGEGMFEGTAGTLQGQPELNATYYIKSAVLPMPTDDCITFSSAASFTLKTWNTAKNWDGTLWTSPDKTNWTVWQGEEVGAAKTGETYCLYVRGNTRNAVITGSYSGYRWVLTGHKIVCSGNIETLRGATGDAPSPTKMADFCYCYMFDGCTSLVDIPTLPAATLTPGCYDSMFCGCTSLAVNVTAPGKEWKIPAASSLYSSWGRNMFTGTAGTLQGQPALNTTYYIVSAPLPAGGPYKETVDGNEWTFTVDAELKASIGSGTYGGDRAVPEATKGAIVIPSTLGGRVVTSIGCYAFRDRGGLTSVAIPSSITIINESAFRGCSGLTTMTIPSNVERIESSAFQECTSLASVAIDAGLKVIEHYAFEDCVALRTVNIPQTVEWVGSSILSGTQYWKDQADGVVVLDGCALGLKGNAPTQLVIPNGVRLIASSAFYGCLSSSLSLPSSLRVIGGNAFQCSHIVAAELPLGVTTVGGSSFCNCAQLTTVTIPSSVRDVGNDAFMSCGNLATLDMAEGVERIGNNAFYGCKALSNIRIPDSVESIGSNAFYDCTGLWTVEIGLAIKDIGGKAFEGCSELRSFGMYGAPTNLGTWAFGGYGKDYKYLDAIKVKDLQKWCANEFDSNTCLLYFTKYNRSYSKLLLNGEPLPVDLAIPNGVSRVGSRTFQYLSLTSVAMPSEVASIGDRAFSGCQYLTNVLLNAGLKIIEGSAFSDCSRLTRITLPTTVESIGAGTFSGCGVLDAVDFECPPPAGIRNAGVKANATIRYNENYEDEWLPVIVACGWTNATAYQPNPSVPGDPGAVVTGDPENGYTIKPSGSNMNVVVSIPSGIEASKVTVEVSPNVLTVTPNGANVKIVKSTNDITSYLDIPSADPSGTIDLSQATVKSEIVKEALDPAKGAEIELNAESPSLTTSETKPGLTYTLHEGATLQGMNPGDSKVGDGQPWTPNITVKGGSSGFYTIGVTK